MDKYIKCDCCGKKIYFDDAIYYMDGYCGTYCSVECFAEIYAKYDLLTMEHVENCLCEVYDDEAVTKRKAEIKLEMQKLQDELTSLEKEL